MNPLTTVRGRGRVLEVYPDRVRLCPAGALGALFSMAGEGECEVRIGNITALEYKKAGPLMTGYLVINYPGAPSSPHGFVAIGESTNQVNTIYFDSGVNEAMAAAKALIEGLIKEQAQTSQPTPVGDTASEIRRLNDLRVEGILTAEEFDQAKRKVLGS